MQVLLSRPARNPLSEHRAAGEDPSDLLCIVRQVVLSEGVEHQRAFDLFTQREVVRYPRIGVEVPTLSPREIQMREPLHVACAMVVQELCRNRLELME
jgi:hypothetical protein